MTWIIYVFLGLISITTITGSSGDTDFAFRYCVRECWDKPQQLNNASYYGLYLEHVLLWDQLSECEYTCMRRISDSREENDYPVLKYFGHWPYHRIVGLQEPASALFSFLNAIPHVYHLTYNRHRLSPSFRCWVVLYGITAVIAWTCSTIFHARKIPISIFMDYASALVFLMFGLFVALRRTLYLSIFEIRPYLSHVLFSVMSWLCLSRVYDMYYGIIRFDNHMSFSIGVAVTHTTVWIVWLIASAQEAKSHKLQCLYLQLWFIAASMLELFDFPPIWYHFDAHSLWHFATIPLGHFWYRFWFQDAIILKKISEKKMNQQKDDSKLF